MKAHTKETQDAITPDIALRMLEEGNARFVSGKQADRNLLDQVSDTKNGQYPFATILGCVDSRVSNELIFDQGVGDIFSARVAGNIVNEDLLGSMEFACKLAGSKAVVVLGHTSCGAVKGACDHAEMGNLTALLKKIEPAVNAVELPAEKEKRTSANLQFVDRVAEKNVQLTIEAIRNQSQVLRDMEAAGEIVIKGAMYDVSTGQVRFM